ncbi:MAG: glucosaminidase domain-containing protein [Planctomycetes bacterium]|nr:glucosaminidase domain-containing protein [Planctomycetota bacterium]
MGDKNPKEYSLAKRMLQGLTSKEPEESPAEPASEDSEPALEGDHLGKILGALKSAAVKISAVEPHDYGHLLRVRTGEPLSLRDRGDKVHALEVALRAAGVADVPSIGRFDTGLEEAVKRFQGQHGLKPSGVFCSETFEALHVALGLAEEADDSAAPAAPRSQAEAQILPPTGNAFLDGLVPGAVRGMHEFGLPASVLLAMAILESQWGERLLARDHHNVFALTGEGSAGSVVMCAAPSGHLEPSGTGTSYRAYSDPADSVADFAEVFAKAADYKGIMTHRGQPDSFARALTGAYSANPQYGSLVLRLMGQFDLYRFDRIAPPSQGW